MEVVSQYVVLGTSPALDVTVAVGPFRTEAKAREASDDLILKGYNVEVCQLWYVTDIDESPAWDGE